MSLLQQELSLDLYVCFKVILDDFVLGETFLFLCSVIRGSCDVITLDQGVGFEILGCRSGLDVVTCTNVFGFDVFLDVEDKDGLVLVGAAAQGHPESDTRGEEHREHHHSDHTDLKRKPFARCCTFQSFVPHKDSSLLIIHFTFHTGSVFRLPSFHIQ